MGENVRTLKFNVYFLILVVPYICPIFLEPVRQHGKTLHFIDSTAFLGCSGIRFFSECSATRKILCIGQNAEFEGSFGRNS
jgi:hypothetical protein